MIVSTILDIVAKLIPGFLTSIANKTLQKKKVIEALKKYEKSSTTASEIREIEKKEDEELSGKWAEKWGDKKEEPTSVENTKMEVEVSVPKEAFVGKKFAIYLSKPCEGCDLYVDAWRMYTLDDKLNHTIALSGAGSRRIRILRKNVEIGFNILEVKDASIQN